MDKIEKAYLDLILEAQYDDDKWQRYGVYKNIEIYYSIDHIIQRLSRYSHIMLRMHDINMFVKRFIKECLSNNILNTSKNEIPFTVHCMLSKVWFSGRFKRNNNVWRIQISTLLPCIDKNGNEFVPKHSPNDYVKDIKI